MTLHTITCANPQHPQRQGWPGWVTTLGTQDDSTVPHPFTFRPLKLVCEACANATRQAGRPPTASLSPTEFQQTTPGQYRSSSTTTTSSAS